MINSEFSKFIKKKRHQMGLSVRALAEKCSLNYTRLSKIENGLRPVPDINAIVLMAVALEVEPDFLIQKAGIVKDGTLAFSSDQGLNCILAEITDWKDNLAEIKDINGHLFSAVTPIKSGKIIFEIPPENISIFIDDQDVITSIRNRIQGNVSSIKTSPGASLVTIDSNGLLIVALVTNRSIESMNIKVGKTVIGRFKAAAVRVKRV